MKDMGSRTPYSDLCKVQKIHYDGLVIFWPFFSIKSLTDGHTDRQMLKTFEFMDVSSHLYKRCALLSVHPSVCPLIHNAFVKMAEIIGF